MEWLNTPGPYVQYTYDPDPKLVAIIQRYSFAFDNNFWYWIPLTRQGGKQATLIVKRSPLWTHPHKTIPAEKAQRKKAAQLHNQKKLILEVFSS